MAAVTAEVKTSKDETKSETPTSTSNKETEISKETVKDAIIEKDTTEKKAESGDEKARKKSVVDIAVIKEKDEKNSLDTRDESLEDSLSKMPGMTKSASRDILKAVDDVEIKQIAADLDDAHDDDDEGSVIDISIVDDSDDNKEDGLGIQAEIIGDDEEVNIVAGKGEQVVEFTLEMKHFFVLLSVMAGMMAVMYALVNKFNM